MTRNEITIVIHSIATTGLRSLDVSVEQKTPDTRNYVGKAGLNLKF